MAIDELERCISDLNGRSQQLLESIALKKASIFEAQCEIVRIEAALQEYYEQLEVEIKTKSEAE